MKPIVKVNQIGDFSSTDRFFNKALHLYDIGVLDMIAQDTLEELKKASPRSDSGYGELHIADLWSYEIIKNGTEFTINFLNSNVQNGINIALIVNDGHLTRAGKWVPGQNYIEEPINKACDRILKHMREGLK